MDGRRARRSAPRGRACVKRPLGLGVVGCGVIGARHVAAAARMPEITVAGLADLDARRVQRLGRAYGLAPDNLTLPDMLAREAVEAVLLAVHPAARLALAREVIASGRHLLLEKPVALHAGEVRQMLAWQRPGQVVACCSARFRCLPGAEAVRAALRTGALGAVRTVHWRVVRRAPRKPAAWPPAWRLQRAVNGGGILMNWGCYDWDYLLALEAVPLRPRWITGRAWTLGAAYKTFVPPPADAETHVVAHVECADGACIAYERGEYVPGRAASEMTVTGENGSLAFQMAPQPGAQDALIRSDAQEGAHTRVIFRHPATAPDLQAAVLRDFAGAVRNRRRPRTDLRHALRVQETIDAIYAAAATGARQEVAGA